MSAFDLVFARARLEEVGERFHRPLDRDGDSLRLAFSTLAGIRYRGRPLIPANAAELASQHGLSSDEHGITVSPGHEPERAEEALRAFFTQLLEGDPTAFFRQADRRIEVPASGQLPESARWLERLYADGFVTRDKKPIVFDLGRSQGPYLRSIDADPLQIIDSASQIATLAAGVRPGFVQAALDDGRLDAHLLCSHDARHGPGAEAARDFRTAVVKQGNPRLSHVAFTNGGSEAVEKAFHLARHYTYPGERGRTRIVAFDGSFHGRTLLPLYSTWNEEKRAPYQLAGFETLWAPFPATLPGVDATFPPGWHAAWADRAGQRAFALNRPASGEDPEVDRARLTQDVASLSAVEAHLQRGDVFAVIVEPYQCEGGDRAATLRFFNGLRALTRGYGVPLIFDEVQSGFGLSGGFFWHRRFWITDAAGEPDGPDLVVGAKRAQVGYVLSRWPDPYPTPSHTASMVRGTLHAQIVEEQVTLAGAVALRLERLVSSLPAGLVTNARAVGDAFAFDLPTPALANHLIDQRFYRGLMVYVAGDRTLRYRLNRAMTDVEVDRIFDGIEASFQALLDDAGRELPQLLAFTGKAPKWVAPPARPKRPVPGLPALLASGSVDLADRLLRVHGQLHPHDRSAAARWLGLDPNVRGHAVLPVLEAADPDAFEAAQGIPLLRFAADVLGTRVRVLGAGEVEPHLVAITELEHASYESARRDRTAYLKLVADSRDAVVVLAEDPRGLVGMSFAGPLELFWGTDGPRQDPRMGQQDTLYSADITVSPEARGRGIGWRLRAAQLETALAMRRADGAPRYHFITGRNRVGSADTMWAINREFRAYTVALMHGQYGERTGLSRYYRLPLRRHLRPLLAAPESVVDLSAGVSQPTGASHPLLEHALSTGVLDEAALTKLTLSNFVTRPFIRAMEGMRAIAPKGTRHLYVTSAPDELTDKTLRVLKYQRKAGRLAVSLSGGTLGHTTAASRSLTDWSTFPGPRGRLLDPDAETFFPFPRVPHPEHGLEGTLQALDGLVAANGADALLGLFVETVQARTGAVLTPEAFAALCAWRDRTGVPLVVAEHTTALGRSGAGSLRFWVDGQAPEADVVLLWAGGQTGYLFMGDRTFVDKPLAFISTWDGDELSSTRLFWQLAAVRDAAVAERAEQLTRGLDRLGIPHRGLGLYRVIQIPQARLDVLQARLAAGQLRVECLGVFGETARLVLAPALTVAPRDLDRFLQTLRDVLDRNTQLSASDTSREPNG